MDDHDQRFKALLKEFLAEFFGLFFPEWAERFDFSRVEWLDKELFPDPPEGRRRSLDLVAKLPTRDPNSTGQPAEVWLSLIHIEVESADSVAPLRRRMHRYYTHLRDEYDLMVLPVAIYLRVGLDGIGTDVFQEFYGSLDVLTFKYLYVGLPGLNAVEYVRRDNVLAAALSALMKISPEEQARIKAEALLRLAESQENEQRKFLLSECVDAYLPLDDPVQKAEFQRLIASEQYREVSTMATTWFEQGLEQGVAEGQRRSVAILIEDRFGEIAPQVRERIEKWPAETLPDLLRKIPHAQSLRDLGLED